MHWFIDPIKNQYADFSGRATRQQFWMFALVYMLIYIALGFVDAALGFGMESLGPLSTLFWLVTLVPALAIGARRLHDTNKTGWMQLIGLIPVIGWIIVIVLMALKGDANENQYGPSPYVSTGPAETVSDPAIATESQASPGQTDQEQ